MIISNTLKFIFFSTPHTHSEVIRRLICKNVPSEISFYCDSILEHAGIGAASQECSGHYDSYMMVRNPYDYLAADYMYIKGMDLRTTPKTNSSLYTKVFKFGLINPTFEVFLNEFHGLKNTEYSSLYKKYKTNSLRSFQYETFIDSVNTIISDITKIKKEYITTDKIDNDYSCLWTKGLKRKVGHKFMTDFLDYGYDC